MPDMLVRLYALPEYTPHLAALAAHQITIRRAAAWEKHILAEWVRPHFGDAWAVACEVAAEQRPVTCFIAVQVDSAPDAASRGLPPEHLVGFACYDVASKGMFGPTGVREDLRKRGIGTGLLLVSLHAMFAEGYAYGIIGQVGPVDYYRKVVGATLIEGSDPGVARRPLRSS